MVSEIRQVAARAGRMHVLFNTNYEDQGQVGARMLRQLLGQTPAPTAGTPHR
jgi:hypothetical protein